MPQSVKEVNSTISISERRKEIIRLLIGGAMYTVDNLAERLGVSRSTIKRDLLILTVDEGWHIDTIPGPGGGVHMTDFEHPHKHILSQKAVDFLNRAMINADSEDLATIREMLWAFS